MSERPSAFGLSADEASSLALDIHFSDLTAEVRSQGRPLFEVQHRLPESDLRDASLYHLFFCITGYSGEAQISRLQMRGTHTGLGYVFPMTAFRGEADFEDTWVRRYAHVAFHKLIDLNNIASFAPEASLDSLRDRQVFPDELFPDDLSIAVVGRGNLDGLGIDVSQFQLMLLSKDITVIDKYDRDRNYFIADTFESSVSVSLTSSVIADDTDVVFRLLSEADAEASEVGRFLRMYQLIEYSIDKIYTWGMKALVGMEMSAWRMKKKLASLTGDRSRLSILASHCLHPTMNQSVLDDVSLSCKQLIDDLGEDTKEISGWHGLLYSVRNIVVHDQIKLIRMPNDHLPAVNLALRSLCLELTSMLVKPDLSKVWETSQTESVMDEAAAA